MQDKILSMLGIARRAGKLEAGYNASVDALRSGKAAFAAAAADISEKTFGNLKYEAERAGKTAVRLECKTEDMSRACGIKAGVIALTDRGFAAAVQKLLAEQAATNEEEC